jgi:hypothetical protein
MEWDIFLVYIAGIYYWEILMGIVKRKINISKKNKKIKKKVFSYPVKGY